MMKMIYRLRLPLTICLAFIVSNCRQDYVPTDEELADYGWILFSDGDYIGARDWFKQAVDKDPTYMDGYCGMGWSNGKLGYADSAYEYFDDGKDLTYDDVRFPNHENLKIDILGGLAFAGNAIGDDNLTIAICQEFEFEEQSIQNLKGDGNWRWSLKEKLFSSLDYDTQINTHDVRLVYAVAQFNKGNFENCSALLREINTDLLNEIMLPYEFPPTSGAITLWTDQNWLYDDSTLVTNLSENTSGWSPEYENFNPDWNTVHGIDSIKWMIDLLQLVLW
tara:strand:+ start:4961 stop:5794 length:834 start_codon:yes stop_codon:yes gene_type:complete